jgi:hypothetical protein
MENMASNSFSTTHACSMEEEIGVYMIATVVVISLQDVGIDGLMNLPVMNFSNE